MRTTIRQLVIDAAPELGGRVFHEGGASATQNQAGPFAVIQRGVTDPEEPFANDSVPVEVWLYTGDQNNSFRTLDEIARKVRLALDERRFDEVVAATGETKRYASFYDVDSTADFIDPDYNGAYGRALRFRVFDIGWMTSLTYSPDPVLALRTFYQQAWSEQQIIGMTGHPNAGTFTLTYQAQTTAPLPFNATTAQIQAALEALPAIGAGNVLVTGHGDPATILFGRALVTFRGALAAQNVPTLAVAHGLVGDSGPVGMTVTVLKEGTPAQTDPLTWNPSDANPALYWRLEDVLERERLNWGSWLTGLFRGHVLAMDSDARATHLRRCVELLSNARYITIEHLSELDILDLRVRSLDNPFRVGQIQLIARWAVNETTHDESFTGAILANAPVRLIPIS